MQSLGGCEVEHHAAVLLEWLARQHLGEDVAGVVARGHVLNGHAPGAAELTPGASSERYAMFTLKVPAASAGATSGAASGAAASNFWRGTCMLYFSFIAASLAKASAEA